MGEIKRINEAVEEVRAKIGKRTADAQS